jgi:hypothetical protein
MEFLQAGVSPARAARTIGQNWRVAVEYLTWAAWPKGFLKSDDGTDADTDFVLCVSPETMRDLTIGGEKQADYSDAFRFTTLGQLGEWLPAEEFQPPVGAPYRWIIIVLQPLMRGFRDAATRHTDVDPTLLVVGLRSEILMRPTPLRDAQELLDVADRINRGRP